MINNKVLKLISPIPVSVNHYIKPRGFVTYITKGGKRIPIAQVTMYETADAKKYKKNFTKYVLQEIINQKWNLEVNKTQHFYIDCNFYFDRTDMDANNYFKIMLDAITDTQKIWQDDNVTCERVNYIGYDTVNPRIELIIYPVDYIGIFKDNEEFTSFQNERCNKCPRKNRNCSILVKATEGRVQEEMTRDEDGILDCSKFKVAKGK